MKRLNGCTPTYPVLKPTTTTLIPPATAATAIGLGTVSTLAATAIGSGIIAGGTTAIMGGDVSDVLESAVVGGLTSFLVVI